MEKGQGGKREELEEAGRRYAVHTRELSYRKLVCRSEWRGDDLIKWRQPASWISDYDIREGR